MDLYLQTRGRSIDYEFLGKAPREFFWDEPTRYSSPEHETLVVLGDGRRFQVYLSGLHSGRKDTVGRVNRFTVVAEGNVGDPDTGALLCWLGLSLEDPREASRRLDRAFPEEYVERALHLRDPAGRADTYRTLQERLRAVMLEAEGIPRTVPSPPGSWLTLDTPEHRAALLGRAEAILVGRRTGLAAILNLVGAPGELSPLLPRFGELAALSDIEGTPAGFAPIVPSPALPETRPRLLPFVILGLGAGAGLYLLRRRMRSQ